MPGTTLFRTVETIGLSVVLLLAGCHSARQPAPPASRLEPADAGSATTRNFGAAAATASATAAEMADVRGGRAEELLAGRFAGVDVVRLPTGDYSIRIRGVRSFMGDNEPLIVIDGIPSPLGVPNPLRDVAPADIARIDVLKDAAATAIYGGRGANGVILIHTKRGW